MKTPLKCPQCHTPVAWQGNPHRPFCSQRCRLIDLGQWVDEGYRIPGPVQGQPGEEDIDSVYDEQQDIERF